jgi:O-antigen biosynthesis protein
MTVPNLSLSILTLVDSAEHLAETYKSLVDQTSKDWQWLVVPTTAVEIPSRVLSDPRFRLVPPSPFAAAQGEVGCQVFAFEQATTSHVMELRQHELLHPQAVATMLNEIKASDADLLYADFVPLGADQVAGEYDSKYGWETYRVGSRNHTYRAIRSFEPEPSALHQAAYAPSMGLTWKRSVFLSLDGPDPNLGRAGRFDLLCRAYVAGFTFRSVRRCIVFSHHDPSVDRDPETEGRVSANHVYDIVHEWSSRQGLAMLHLGGGGAPAGFTSVGPGDVRLGLPFGEATVGCIRAFDFLGRLAPCSGPMCGHGGDAGPRCVVGVMNDLHRVLVPGGWIISETASSDGRGAFQNPTYTSFWNPNSFWYYSRRESADTVPGIDCRFQVSRVWQFYPSEWHEANHILHVHADLVALKGQRQPGICEI